MNNFFKTLFQLGKENQTFLWVLIGAPLFTAFYGWGYSWFGAPLSSADERFYMLLIAIVFVAMDVDKMRNKNDIPPK